MIQSATLKNFVHEHESKLQAKLRGLDGDRAERELHGNVSRTASRRVSGAAQHWNESDMDRQSRRRPSSTYFNFIVTATD